jgi:hypothetical protein
MPGRMFDWLIMLRTLMNVSTIFLAVMASSIGGGFMADPNVARRKVSQITN